MAARWTLTLALWLCVTQASAVTLILPAGGLPAGSSGGRAVGVPQASPAAWRTLRRFALSQGFNGSWSALDERSGRLAVSPLLQRLKPDTLAEMDRDGLPAERLQELTLAFQSAQNEAAPEAERLAQETREELASALSRGLLGAGDLERATQDLQGLSAYGGRALEAYAEARSLSEEHQRSRILDGASRIAAGLGRAHTVEEIPPGHASVPSALKPRTDLVPESSVDLVPAPPANNAGYRHQSSSLWSQILGWALIGSSTLFLVGLVPAVLPLTGIFMATGGFALLILSTFLKTPTGASATVPESSPTPFRGLFSSFRQLYAAASRSLGFQVNFEGAVGGASVKTFKTWLMGAARSALYWLPLGLGGLLAGSILAWPMKKLGWITDGAAAGGAVIDSPMSVSLSGYFFLSVAMEALLLGVVFNGLRRMGKRLFPGGPTADLAASVITLAAAGTFLFLTGLPAAIIMPMLGFEAVMIYIYARSGSLAVPVLARALMSLASVESARMAIFLEFGPASLALAAMPGWAGLAVLGIAVGGLALWSLKGGWAALKTLASREVSRLQKIGAYWSRSDPEGRPRSPWPVLAAGVFWGLIAYAFNDMTYWAVQFISPMTEPAPEILKRLLSMPLDVIAFNFMIVVLLEEWVFRRGIFKPMGERVRKWKLPARWWFWPAAIASSVIFSLAHFVDFGSILAALGITSAGSAAFAGTYAWSWAGFAARVSAGMILAFLYARSGLLLIPMIAHFVSNALESVGLRFGFPVFLLTAAALLASYIWSTRPKHRP